MPLAILAVALGILIWFWSVLVVFVLAALLAFILNPLIEFFPRKVPRWLAIALVYLAIYLIIAVVISILIPLITEQIQQLIGNLPGYVSTVQAGVNRLQARYANLPSVWRSGVDYLITQFQQVGTYLSSRLVPAATAVFSGLLALVFIPLLALFMLLGKDGYRHVLIAVTPEKHREAVVSLLHCSGHALWKFIRGELILMATVGAVTGIGLYLVGMPYSAIFGVVAGILELIPTFGPILTSVVVGITAVLISPVMLLKALSITIGVQVLENAFLVPVVMGRTVGLNPITVAVAVFIGGMVAGVIGAVLAVPAAVLIKIIVLYFYASPEDLPEGEAAICRSHAWDERRNSTDTS